MFISPFNFNLLDGNNGFVVRGIDEADNLGSSVSGGGDINGDGLDDIAIAASDSTSEGVTYVVFGSNDNFTTEYDLTNLDGNNGFVIRGIETTDNILNSTEDIPISITGDLNGDGFDDLIIGAPGAGKNIYVRELCDEPYCETREYEYIRGESYVIFGGSEGFPDQIDVADLDGTNGFSLVGSHRDGAFGTSVSSAGDVNGDGIDDIVIGAPYADELREPGSQLSAFRARGESYVVFGSREGFPTQIDVADLDGTNGFMLRGASDYDLSGSSVSSAGDINGDGIDDLIIEIFGFSRYSKSGSYIVFGSNEEFAAQIDLGTLDGTNGFEIRHWERSTPSTSSGGDINGDGIDDIFISVVGRSWREAPYDSIENYVLFGSNEEFTAEIDLNTLDGSNGFSIDGIDNVNNSNGITLSRAGDVNGDGIDDAILAASGAGEFDEDYADSRYYFADNRGKSYVIFGNSNGFDSNFDLNNLDGSNGLVLNGIDEDDRSGTSVSSAGDLNGDGVDDIIIGAPDAEAYYSEQGEAYVVFGSNSSESEQNDNRIAISDVTLEEGNEGNTEFIFTVSLEEASQETIAVDFTTEDRIAIAEKDYIATEGTLEFSPGETEKTVVVEVTGNSDLEENETFLLNLSNASGAAIADGRGIATITNDDLRSPENTIELFRFRNTTLETDTYIFVGEAEKEAILDNPNYNQIFAEVEGYTFMASSVPRDDLLPFYRLRSLDVPGTYLFVSTEEYDAIFADDSEQQDKWVKEGLNNENEDIPDFYLLGDSADRGMEFHRFQNRQYGTFLYADPAETEAIVNNEDLSSVWIHQGVAFESI